MSKKTLYGISITNTQRNGDYPRLLNNSIQITYSKIRVMKRTILFLSFFMFSFVTTKAQSWQWGIRGGSAETYSAGPDETVVDMATDPAGNVYVLSEVLQTGLNVDGNSVTGWGVQDILITSFRCDGTYRWSKDIGGSSDDVPMALKTDTLGGVYVTGVLATYFITIHVDADTSWPSGSSYKNLFIAKFDTAGNYQWLTMPQADTVGLASIENTGIFDMDVDGAGNIYWMCFLSPGSYADGGYVVTTPGTYTLEYDGSGHFVSGTTMQIGCTGVTALLKMKRDFGNGRYYVTGTLPTTGGTLSFAGAPVTQGLFLGCFDNSGNLLWSRANTSTEVGAGFGRADVDAGHNIYVVGTSNYFAANDTFNGYTVQNTLATYGGIPLVVKLDTNGNNVWAANASCAGATPCSEVKLNGSEVDISGSYGSEFKWSGFADSITSPAGAGYYIFITRFNAVTGAVIGLDSIAGDYSGNEFASGIASDKSGNFYVGGNFSITLYVPVAGDTLTNIGGNSDFFVAKYGTDNCSALISESVATAPPLSAANILAFPNPTNGELNITGVPQVMRYSLLSVTGTLVQAGMLQAGANTLSVAYLSAGVYVLEMTGGDGSKQERKIIVGD